MTNVALKLMIAIAVLAVFLWFSPLIIGALLDIFGTAGSLVVVVLLFAALLTVGISRLRRKR